MGRGLMGLVVLVVLAAVVGASYQALKQGGCSQISATGKIRLSRSGF
jgi:hypothetical protein